MRGCLAGFRYRTALIRERGAFPSLRSGAILPAAEMPGILSLPVMRGDMGEHRRDLFVGDGLRFADAPRHIINLRRHFEHLSDAERLLHILADADGAVVRHQAGLFVAEGGNDVFRKLRRSGNGIFRRLDGAVHGLRRLVDERRDRFMQKPEDLGIDGVGVDDGEDVRTFSHDAKVHFPFKSRDAVTFNSVAVKIHDDDVGGRYRIIGHPGGRHINIAGFGITDAEVSPGLDGKSRGKHPFSAFDEQSFAVHKKASFLLFCYKE